MKTKIKILYWVISVAFVLCGVFFLFSLLSRKQPLPVNNPAISESWKIYESKNMGFSVSHPPSWAVEVVSSETVTFSNISGPGEISISVTNPTMLDVIKKSFNADSEKQISLANKPATQLIENGKTPNDAMELVLAVHDGKLFYISGQVAEFDKILETFTFLSNN